MTTSQVSGSETGELLPREAIAYESFRAGCRTKPPIWGELDAWQRDAMKVAYLQGILDAPPRAPPQAEGEAQSSCPCGVGAEPCPRPDGTLLCGKRPTPTETVCDQVQANTEQVLPVCDHLGGEKAALWRDTLIQISDRDWQWSGGGSDVRYRGAYGKLAASALGIPEALSFGWPSPSTSETREALATKSASDFKASHPPRMSAQGERDPSVMPDCSEADTAASLIANQENLRGSPPEPSVCDQTRRERPKARLTGSWWHEHDCAAQHSSRDCKWPECDCPKKATPPTGSSPVKRDELPNASNPGSGLTVRDSGAGE